MAPLTGRTPCEWSPSIAPSRSRLRPTVTAPQPQTIQGSRIGWNSRFQTQRSSRRSDTTRMRPRCSARSSCSTTPRRVGTQDSTNSSSSSLRSLSPTASATHRPHCRRRLQTIPSYQIRDNRRLRTPRNSRHFDTTRMRPRCSANNKSHTLPRSAGTWDSTMSSSNNPRRRNWVASKHHRRIQRCNHGSSRML